MRSAVTVLMLPHLRGKTGIPAVDRGEANSFRRRAQRDRFLMSANELVNSDSFRTLNQLFLGAVKKHSWPNAFLRKTQGRYEGFSSERTLETTAALASALLRKGIRAGDRVAILAENRLEWALTDYALMGLRSIGIPIYPTLLEPDIEFILRDSETKAIVVSTPAQLT